MRDHNLFRATLGALSAVALGFGASQAFAGPLEGRTVAASCTRAEATQCTQDCRDAFGSRAGGKCTRTAEGVSCECYVTQI
jgi:hypothetical protein